MTEKDSREALKDALASLQREFPDAWSLRVDVELGEVLVNNERRSTTYWTVGVNGNSTWSETLEEALADLRKDIDLRARALLLGERVAAVLRETSDKNFGRSLTLQAAHNILAKEEAEK